MHNKTNESEAAEDAVVGDTSDHSTSDLRILTQCKQCMC